MEGDGLAQPGPGSAGEHRHPHYGEEPRRVLFRDVEVRVGVEPHDPEILGADPGGGAQGALAVDGEHERERTVYECQLDPVGQAPDQLDDPRDLAIALVGRLDLFVGDGPGLGFDAGAELAVASEPDGPLPMPTSRRPLWNGQDRMRRWSGTEERGIRMTYRYFGARSFSPPLAPFAL